MKYKIEQEWLEQRYVCDLARVEDIALEAGCTVANIRRYLKKWKILRGKEIQRSGIVPAWNKGLTKDDDERLLAISEAHSGAGNPMAMKDPWNKGLTKETDKRVLAISEGRLGIAFSEETRRRMSDAKTGMTLMWSNRWKGGRSNCNKYAVSMSHGRYRYEHRVVAEKALGRSLCPHEQIHHMDKNPMNNSVCNLIVIAIDDHAKLHNAMREFPALDQRVWLKENNIHFEDLEYEDSGHHASE